MNTLPQILLYDASGLNHIPYSKILGHKFKAKLRNRFYEICIIDYLNILNAIEDSLPQGLTIFNKNNLDVNKIFESTEIGIYLKLISALGHIYYLRICGYSELFKCKIDISVLVKD